MPPPPPVPKLLLITDHHVCPDLERGVESALQGGVRHLLLRIKTAPPGQTLAAEVQRWAEKLHPLTRRYRAHLLISEHLSVALSLDGVGLHLPERGIDTAEARKKLGDDRLLGRSCHDLKGVKIALSKGANYTTLSPLFATATHPDAVPIGPERFAQWRAALPGPVLALGGIDADSLEQAMACGADGVGVIRAILAHPSPRQAARHLLALMARAENPRSPS